MGLGVIVVLLAGNLRGVRQAGSLFAATTYAFIGVIAGLVHAAGRGFQPVAVHRLPVLQDVSVLLVLRAFSSGATAMTGIEAALNALPAFKPQSGRNAQITMSVMVGLLITMFAGVLVVARLLGVVPEASQTMLSQLAHLSLGDGPGHVFLQAATAAVYAAFGGRTEALLPLYAVGVFLAFTLSQVGIVAHALNELKHDRRLIDQTTCQVVRNHLRRAQETAALVDEALALPPAQRTAALAAVRQRVRAAQEASMLGTSELTWPSAGRLIMKPKLVIRLALALWAEARHSWHRLAGSYGTHIYNGDRLTAVKSFAEHFAADAAVRSVRGHHFSRPFELDRDAVTTR